MESDKMKPEITVSILSWLLEDRLIKTLISIPRTTSKPLALCLHVQGSEQLSAKLKQDILDATAGFVLRDVFFTEGNQGSAGPRADLIRRSAKTPYVFMTDNDMVFQDGTIDELYKFLTDEKNSSYGMVDTVHNYLRWHRRVEGTDVICTPVDFDERFVDVDLIGAASILMRKEVALIPGLIDERYILGTWDFDMCLNVKKAGWKIATFCDEGHIAINDKTYRTPQYKREKVYNPIRLKGLRLFEEKWGFSSEYYPNNKKEVEKLDLTTFVFTRAIYSSLGERKAPGVLTKLRLYCMQNYFINSLANQTNKNFTLYVITGDENNEATEAIKKLDWKDLNVKYIYTTSDLSEWQKSISESNNWGRETDKGCPEDIARSCNHPLAPIMVRIDNDDWVAPGWIAHIKHMAQEKNEDSFIINYQVISQGPDGRLYKFFAPHNQKRISPFLAIIQKTEQKIGPYQELHLKMFKHFDTVYTIPPSYAFMVCHGENRSNRIYMHDVAIDGRRDTEGENTPVTNTKPSEVIDIKRPRINVNKVSWRDKMKKKTIQ